MMNCKLASIRRRSGLTLIEVMMALAIMAVLSAMALPALGTRLERQRLAMAAETLAADITEARQEAARRGLPVNIQALAGTEGQAWCWGITAANAPPLNHCVCASEHNCGHRAVAALDHPGVKLVQGRRVQVSADGSALPGTAAVFESPAGERLRVDLLALGRARICNLSGTPSRYPGC